MHRFVNLILCQFIFVLLFANLNSANAVDCSDISATPQAVITPMSQERCNQFTFDGSKSYHPQGIPLTYDWDLGDGTTSTEEIIDHKYDQPGDYMVTLTVKSDSTDDTTCHTAQTSQKIRVALQPNVSFTAPNAVCVNTEITLDGSATDPNLQYVWNFGDGTADANNDLIVKKTYTQGGKYNVQLTVDNGSNTICSTNTFNKTISVAEPPKAHAGQDISEYCLASADDLSVNFDASNSKVVSEDLYDFIWDFGDGTTGNGINVTHLYPKAGEYEVHLTVQDKNTSELSCGSSTDTLNVILRRAPIAEAGEDLNVCVGEEVNIDGQASYVDYDDTLLSNWDFGDGSNERGIEVKHTYHKAGIYQAKLTVQNAHQHSKTVGPTHECSASSDTRIINVNNPPSADLTASNNVACTGSEFTFDASGSSDADGDNLTYKWDFGDGEVEFGDAQASHTYTKSGEYTVTVIADDSKESSCSRSAKSIKVKLNSPPVADGVVNATCCAGEKSTFDASNSTDPDGDNLNYHWEFGDGTSAEGKKTEHIYQDAGTYEITLTVDDSNGSECGQSTKTFTANISAAPVPVIEVR